MAELYLPAREVFCRALSRLSDRPALILPALPAALPSSQSAALEENAREVTIPLTSELFALGWHPVERRGTSAFRWMTQIGIILNPSPQRSVARVEVVVEGWYGQVFQALAAASERDRLGMMRHQLEDGSCECRHLAGNIAGKPYEVEVCTPRQVAAAFEIASAIEPATYERMSRNARARIRASYTIDAIGPKVAARLESITAK